MMVDLLGDWWDWLGDPLRPHALKLAQNLRIKGRGAARKALQGIKRGLYREVPGEWREWLYQGMCPMKLATG